MLHGNALPPEERAGLGDGQNDVDMLNPDHGPGVKRNRSGSFSNVAHKKSPVISALPQPISAGSKFAIKIPDLQDDDEEASQKYAQFGAGRSSRPADTGPWSGHSSAQQRDHTGMSLPSNMDEEAVQDIPFEAGPSSQGADTSGYGQSLFVSPKPASTGGLGNFLWVPGPGSTGDSRDKFAFTPGAGGGGGGGSRFSENEGRDRNARESRFSPSNGDANSQAADNGWTDARYAANRVNQNVFAGGSRYPSALDAHVPAHVQDRFAMGGSSHTAQVILFFHHIDTYVHTCIQLCGGWKHA
jgi:hypothetical protein